MQISLLLKPNNLVDCEPREFNSLKDLGQLIIKNSYSGIIFKNNYRKETNFDSSEMIILDFDNMPDGPQLTINEAIALFAGHKCLIATTRNHQREKHDVRADRFRVILFTAGKIKTAQDYKATYLEVVKSYPAADQKCKDAARFFYSSTEVRYVNEQGALITPTIARPSAPAGLLPTVTLKPGERGRLAFKTQDFLKNGAPKGTWNNRIYIAARDYLEQGYTQEEFIEAAERITGELDSNDLTSIRSAFSKEPKYSPRVPEVESNMAEAERWVRDWLEENKIAISYRTGVITYKNMDIFPDVLLSTIYLNACKWAEENPIVGKDGELKKRMPYSSNMIEHVVKVWLEEQPFTVLNEYKDLLGYVGPNDSMQKFILAVTGKDSPLDVAVMRHFVWQIKRKLMKLPVEYHMMPIFQGPSGSGKTEAIKRLLKPISELVNVPPFMTMLDDAREAMAFQKFYVTFFDEMAKVEKLSVDSLKNKITSETINYRRLGTNIQAVVSNNTTFLAATNNDVVDLIYDPTSARRFWQIDSMKTCDWKAVNDINYLNVWQSVDENSECPIIPFLEQIAHIQNSVIRAKSPVEVWLETYRGSYELSIVNNEADSEVFWNSASFYFEKFMEWGQQANYKHMVTLERFGRALIKLGVERRRTNTGTQYRISTNKEPAKATVISFTK